jgi:hypothetical protein
MTFADVSHARALLKYEPAVSLAQGVRQFLQWYGQYYGVELPSHMAPNRREAAELRDKCVAPSLSGAASRRARALCDAAFSTRQVRHRGESDGTADARAAWEPEPPQAAGLSP